MLMMDGSSKAVFAACDWCDGPVTQGRDWMVWPDNRTAQARVALLHDACILPYAELMYRTRGLKRQQIAFLKCQTWVMQVGVAGEDMISVTVESGPQKLGAA
jgi:hypothetical protein